MSALIRLYPRAWRERYEAEFLTLLEARPPTLYDRFDIVRGALDARLHPQVRSAEREDPSVPEGDRRIARVLGYAGIAGAILWPLSFLVMLAGPVVYDGDGAYRDGSAAFPFFFGAVVLMVAGLIGHLITLPRTAVVGRASALIAIPLFLLLGMGPWMWYFGLAAFFLVAVLAVTGQRAGTWSPWASFTVVCSVLGVMLIGVVGASLATDRMSGGAFFVVAGMALVPVWLAVGGTLMRDGQSVAAA
ncbi:MAG TPA: hypothetical protein VFV72_17225 [Candidatus Limnocylindrales bacterium]|nr:hypothetical protein [Candidatus Limnocylindrales bacterium]